MRSKLLGGPGKATGNVVEIWGGMGTQPAHDRHDGFHDFTDKEPGIKYLLDKQSGDWKQDKAYDIMATALRNNEKIDLVYGHNDPMAYGAYLAAKDAGREKDIKFIGIDALPDEGVTWVNKGELTATFLYADAGRRGPAPGGQAPERRDGREDRSRCDTMTMTQGQRRRDPEGERADVTETPRDCCGAAAPGRRLQEASPCCGCVSAVMMPRSSARPFSRPIAG